MTALCIEPTETPLESLLLELARLRWSAPFGADDLQAILGTTDSCQGLISQGIVAGFFIRDHASYRLTTAGRRKLKTLRATLAVSSETSKAEVGPQRSLRNLTKAMAPVDSENESGGFDHYENLESPPPRASRVGNSTFLESSPDLGGTDDHSRNVECTQISDHSRNLELSELPETSLIFETPMDDSQNVESANFLPVFSADSIFLESTRRVGVQNPEGIRKYPNKNIDNKDQIVNLDLLGSNQHTTRARPRSKLDTTLAWDARREERISELRKNARQLVGKRSLHTTHPDHVRMRLFAEALDKAHCTYKGARRRYFKFVKPEHVDSEHRMYKLYVKAARLAESVGADYVAFIKSQFYWFEIKHQRAPKIWEIASQYATARWESYSAGVAAGKINAGTNPRSRVVKAPSSQNVRFSRCDGVLRALMRNYEVTEADVLRVFAMRNESISFDQDWLDARPIYQQLKAEGVFDA